MAGKSNNLKIKVELPPLPEDATGEQQAEWRAAYKREYGRLWKEQYRRDPTKRKQSSEAANRYYYCRKARDPSFLPKLSRRMVCRKAGITMMEYDQMLKGQDGVCAICGETGSTRFSLAIDHDHATGDIRALLCNSCNQGLGRFTYA